MSGRESVDDCGGNRVGAVAPGPGRRELACGPYVYRLVRRAAGEAATVDDLASYVVYVRDTGREATVAVGDDVLAAGDAVRAGRTPLTHLADVVRVADDTHRPDGRIAAEHAPPA